MSSVFKRNDLVVYIDDKDMPRVGLVTSARGATKEHIFIYELGRRNEVHVSQVLRVNRKEPRKRSRDA